jgi:hypothetical protein
MSLFIELTLLLVSFQSSMINGVIVFVNILVCFNF